MIDKYKNRGFEIMAANVVPEEDDFVLSVMKGFKLGFIPLKGGDPITSAYQVRGEPTNFLIGPDGRLYYGQLNPISSPEAQRTLELQVASLLQMLQTETK